MNSPFDQYLAQTPVDMTKSAADIQYENAYWDALAVKYASTENDQIANLFNAAFEDEIQKIASADPEFADILLRQMAAAAFNEGYAQVKGA